MLNLNFKKSGIITVQCSIGFGNRADSSRTYNTQYSQAPSSSSLVFLKILFNWERETETIPTPLRGEAEGQVDCPLIRGCSMRAHSQDPEIMTWADVRHIIDLATHVPTSVLFNNHVPFSPSPY